MLSKGLAANVFCWCDGCNIIVVLAYQYEPAGIFVGAPKQSAVVVCVIPQLTVLPHVDSVTISLGVLLSQEEASLVAEGARMFRFCYGLEGDGLMA